MTRVNLNHPPELGHGGPCLATRRSFLAMTVTNFLPSALAQEYSQDRDKPTPHVGADTELFLRWRMPASPERNLTDRSFDEAGRRRATHRPGRQSGLDPFEHTPTDECRVVHESKVICYRRGGMASPLGKIHKRGSG
jgi:hypothetical protein